MNTQVKSNIQVNRGEEATELVLALIGRIESLTARLARAHKIQEPVVRDYHVTRALERLTTCRVILERFRKERNTFELPKRAVPVVSEMKQYRLLRAGEIIQASDQVLVSNRFDGSTWKPVQFTAGQPVSGLHAGQFRREIK